MTRPAWKNLIRETVEKRERLNAEITRAGGKVLFDDPAITFQPAKRFVDLVQQGEDVGLPIGLRRDQDVKSLQETTLYGIRGTAAYADHASILGQEDEEIYVSLHEKLTKYDR